MSIRKTIESKGVIQMRWLRLQLNSCIIRVACSTVNDAIMYQYSCRHHGRNMCIISSQATKEENLLMMLVERCAGHEMYLVKNTKGFKKKIIFLKVSSEHCS